MNTQKIQALLERATHSATPREEARTSAMIAAELIWKNKYEFFNPSSNQECLIFSFKVLLETLAHLAENRKEQNRILREENARLQEELEKLKVATKPPVQEKKTSSNKTGKKPWTGYRNSDWKFMPSKFDSKCQFCRLIPI